MELPFDTIVVRTTSAGSERIITLEALLSISLTDRVRLILERRIEFRKGRKAISTSEALRSLFEKK